MHLVNCIQYYHSILRVGKFADIPLKGKLSSPLPQPFSGQPLYFIKAPFYATIDLPTSYCTWDFRVLKNIILISLNFPLLVQSDYLFLWVTFLCLFIHLFLNLQSWVNPYCESSPTLVKLGLVLCSSIQCNGTNNYTSQHLASCICNLCHLPACVSSMHLLSLVLGFSLQQ